MIILPTEFEFSTFTHYENMKGNAKRRDCGGLGWLGSSKVIGNIIIQSRVYEFLFEFNIEYTYTLYRFRVIASYLLKVINFNLHHLNFAPSMAVTPIEFRQDLWQ